jgi:Zn-dependent protease
MPESARFSLLVEATRPGLWSAVAALLSIMFSLNLLLAIFNLIPVPPLDGHSAVGLLMEEDTLRKWHEFSSNPQFTLIGMLIAWQLIDQIFQPLFTMALNVLYPGAQFT